MQFHKREREAITFCIFNLYIQTPPMLLGSNFNPRIISSIIQGPGCQELKTHPGSGTLYDLALNYKLSCIVLHLFPNSCLTRDIWNSLWALHMNYVLLLASIKTRTGQVRHIIHTRQILLCYFKELECNEETHFP